VNNPLILSLDSHGIPHRWISWQQACFYYAKNLVAWTLGDETFTFYGGISRSTGNGDTPTRTRRRSPAGRRAPAPGDCG